MIYKDIEGFPVDKSGDGGDTAMRVGILLLTRHRPLTMGYPYPDGLVRHTKQIPWNNPKNFSRDQLIPYIAGLDKIYFTLYIKDIFKAHAKRLFFCQNFERDYPGTTKYPWPHKMTGGDLKDEGKWRMFDFADPLLPNHIWFLIKAARVYALYPFALIGIPFFLLTLLLHSYQKGKEQNQMIAECFVNGPWALKLYKKLVTNWEEDSYNYWNSRDEVEYHHLICDLLKGY